MGGGAGRVTPQVRLSGGLDDVGRRIAPNTQSLIQFDERHSRNVRPLTACCPPPEGDVEEAAPAELSSRLTLSIESDAETRLEVIPAAAAVEAFLRNDCSSTTLKKISKMLWNGSRYGAATASNYYCRVRLFYHLCTNLVILIHAVCFIRDTL